MKVVTPTLEDRDYGGPTCNHSSHHPTILHIQLVLGQVTQTEVRKNKHPRQQTTEESLRHIETST